MNLPSTNSQEFNEDSPLLDIVEGYKGMLRQMLLLKLNSPLYQELIKLEADVPNELQYDYKRVKLESLVGSNSVLYGKVSTIYDRFLNLSVSSFINKILQFEILQLLDLSKDDLKLIKDYNISLYDLL